jgi:hypothetical protein
MWCYCVQWGWAGARVDQKCWKKWRNVFFADKVFKHAHTHKLTHTHTRARMHVNMSRAERQRRIGGVNQTSKHCASVRETGSASGAAFARHKLSFPQPKGPQMSRPRAPETSRSSSIYEHDNGPPRPLLCYKPSLHSQPPVTVSSCTFLSLRCCREGLLPQHKGP